MFKKDIFSYPKYCEIAYDWDRRTECDFIEECIKRYSAVEVRSILDIACGPGIHLKEFARRGYNATGIDKSRRMAEFVNRKAKLENLAFNCVYSDMKSFRLDGGYECAICMLDSFRYLLADEDILSHFDCVAKALKGGGLYIVDLWMPRDERGDCLGGTDGGAIEWEEARWVRQDKGLAIEATYLQLKETLDAKDRTFEDELVFKVKGRNFRSTIKARARTRLLRLGELKRLLRESRTFDFIGRFYNFDFNSNENYNIKAIRTVIILRRRGLEQRDESSAH